MFKIKEKSKEKEINVNVTNDIESQNHNTLATGKMNENENNIKENPTLDKKLVPTEREIAVPEKIHTSPKPRQRSTK